MRRLKDPNHTPITPKFWTAPNGTRIQWRSDRQPFEQFLSVVVEYHNANQFPPPTREQVEDEMCKQLPSWACVGEGYHTVNHDPIVTGSSRGGCRSCGKRG